MLEVTVEDYLCERVKQYGADASALPPPECPKGIPANGFRHIFRAPAYSVFGYCVCGKRGP